MHRFVPVVAFVLVVAGCRCAVVLDLASVLVSARNLGADPLAYLAAVPGAHVAEHHVAGHAELDGASLATRDRAVAAPVWALLAAALAGTGRRTTLLAWQSPRIDVEVVAADLERARAVKAAA